MSYVAKHAAPKQKRISRLVGACAVAGAAAVGGLSAQAASAAPMPAAGGNVWDRVAACESNGNWSISTGNGYYGGLQFSASSWRAAGGAKYASLPHRATKGQQIAAAQNLLRMQGPGAWPVCSRKAGLTRANGLSAGGGAAAVKKATPAKQSTSSAARVSGTWLNSIDTRRLHTYLGLKRDAQMSTSDIRALQRKVGARADGIIGSNTVAAVERHVGAPRTGKAYFTKSTVNKLSSFVRANA